MTATLGIYADLKRGLEESGLPLEEFARSLNAPGKWNQLYLDLTCQTMKHILATKGKPPVSKQECGVVLATFAKITFNKAVVDIWYKKKPTTPGQIATTISKDLYNLLSTPSEKAKFGYAKVEPWEESKLAMCYQNVGRYVRKLPDTYEALFVYTVWDQGDYYELEPHALVRDKATKQVKDITPTLEALKGQPSLPKVCFVEHSCLVNVICSANAIRLQYGFIVEKTKKSKRFGRT
ncbi:expressed unknown protein [Seminavis robusta]|uniref:Uncharacterized protein n=1 Tax=Seminavis robusta TaxID=568900 RepID=A0A9N8D9N1_9STRA|nr:expressed unknown protein [Seminavis robusta]|eukprot:Sro5_g004640.1 n/a (236) ;mRNA; f:211007-211714